MIPIIEEQTDFIPVLTRRADPETSKAAAAVLEEKQERLQRSIRTVIEILGCLPPMNDFQIRDFWPDFWEGPFSENLPRMARLWARRRGIVKRAGFNDHEGRRVQTWTLGDDRLDAETEHEVCPHCGHRMRRKKV